MAAPSARWTNVALALSIAGFLSLQFAIVRPKAQTTTPATSTTTAISQVTTAKDPGPRGGDAGAGAPIDGLSGPELEYFNASLDEFSETEDVGDGLGPRMNLDSGKGCHLHPAVGGSSPARNAQFAFGALDGGADSTPSFI